VGIIGGEESLRRNMNRFICKLILVILMSQLSVGPLYAQDNSRQFQRPMDDLGSAGTSFRKTNLQQQFQSGQNGGADNVMKKGMMMTDPSMAGLTYQVHVLGEVKFPGTFKINASDRLSEVLNIAGGVNDQGSQRNIEVRRIGERTKPLDLIRFQLFGDLSDNPYLLDNDVIFVPLAKSTIQVAGAVKRPRDYELKSEKNLADAVKLAGGFSIGAASDSPIRVIRFVDGIKEVIEVGPTQTEMTAFAIQNGDVIFIPHMITEKNKFDYDIPKLPGDNIFYPSFEDRVFILGGVIQPGPYTFNPYYRLPQYLSLAGGTSKMHTGNIWIIDPDGNQRKLKKSEMNNIIINPGDTVKVGERRIAPEGWVAIIMGIASFGLSATATVLALTDRR